MRESHDKIDREQGTRKQESALRIMGALSGVDEKLLERSNMSGRRKNITWGQYGICAAVVCAAVLGASTWRGYQLMKGADGTGAAASDNSGGSAVQMSGAAVSGEEGGGKYSSGTEISALVNSDRGEIQEDTSLSAVSNGNDIQDSVTEGCGGMLLNPGEKLTEEEARNCEILGSYIPEKIPGGYVFESAYWYEEAQELTILWCKGMDDIHLSIKKAEECEIVNINEPETYDVRLYEIPYGETVPQEYRVVFDNPVFAWEDFSVEIIQSRMRTVEDRGDTITPRGNFGILFTDNYLVEFQGKATINQVWEMFESLGL